MQNYSKLLNELSLWLRARFKKVDKLKFVAIFGSVSNVSACPGDCDIVLVTYANPDSEDWAVLNREIRSVKTDFGNRFDLRLHVTLLTTVEWMEVEGLFIGRVEIINRNV